MVKWCNVDKVGSIKFQKDGDIAITFVSEILTVEERSAVDVLFTVLVDHNLFDKEYYGPAILHRQWKITMIKNTESKLWKKYIWLVVCLV